MASRPLFVMYKVHYPTYREHLLRMRERTNALIDAYLATELEPLRRLHCRWRVDYLIVTREHFGPAGERPSYFAPFDARIEQILSSHRPEDFLLNRPDRAAVALETGRYTVLDLAALTGGAAGCAAKPEVATVD